MLEESILERLAKSNKLAADIQAEMLVDFREALAASDTTLDGFTELYDLLTASMEHVEGMLTELTNARLQVVILRKKLSDGEYEREICPHCRGTGKSPKNDP